MFKTRQWFLSSMLVLLCGTTTAYAQIESPQKTSTNQYFPVNVTQSVKVAENSIIVTVYFENISKEPVLIKEGVWGIQARGRPQQAYALAEPELLMTAGGKSVEYIGPVVKRRPYTRENFVLFSPGEKSSRSIQIAGDFRFLPGEHEYEIIHSHLRLDDVSGQISGFQSRPVKFRYVKK
jgi:hypothetical protein